MIPQTLPPTKQLPAHPVEGRFHPLHSAQYLPPHPAVRHIRWRRQRYALHNNNADSTVQFGKGQYGVLSTQTVPHQFHSFRIAQYIEEATNHSHTVGSLARAQDAPFSFYDPTDPAIHQQPPAHPVEGELHPLHLPQYCHPIQSSDMYVGADSAVQFHTNDTSPTVQFAKGQPGVLPTQTVPSFPIAQYIEATNHSRTVRPSARAKNGSRSAADASPSLERLSIRSVTSTTQANIAPHPRPSSCDSVNISIGAQLPDTCTIQRTNKLPACMACRERKVFHCDLRILRKALQLKRTMKMVLRDAPL
ncbi:hypothetical protein B0H14DRAFT_3760706 [Mycena olivaceomarginata]|nr:hypothetical protein B0H14DRAFT_3760706 [Mycena olivaceomarginata]